MNIEKSIKSLRVLAQWNEDNGCLDSASEKRQIANWLQELKERREKESRQEEVIRDLDKPYTEGDITPREAFELSSRLIERIIEMLPNIIDSVIANMPDVIEEYLRRKEEES